MSLVSSGKYQTSTVNGGYIYTSNDYGVTWTPRDSLRNWTIVSVSSNALYQTAFADSNWYRSIATGTVTSFSFNLDTGSTFFLTGTAPTANYSANFTVSALNTERTYLIMLINNTSTAASFYCTSITINGIAVSTVYSVSPTLTSAVVTSQEISLFYNSTASAWQADSIVKNYQAE